MSKRPLPSTSTGEPNHKKSSFRFARDPSEVVANSTKVGKLPSGRIKQTSQNTVTPSVSSSTIAPETGPLPQDQPLNLDDPNGMDVNQVDLATEVLSKPKRKKRTNTTSVSNASDHDM